MCISILEWVFPSIHPFWFWHCLLVRCLLLKFIVNGPMAFKQQKLDLPMRSNWNLQLHSPGNSNWQRHARLLSWIWGSHQTLNFSCTNSCKFEFIEFIFSFTNESAVSSAIDMPNLNAEVSIKLLTLHAWVIVKIQAASSMFLDLKSSWILTLNVSVGTHKF